jgi:acyl-CoA thioesterase-1
MRLGVWLAILPVAISACSDAPDYAPVADAATVLAFGDSVTHGTGASRGEDYPAQLAELTGWRIVNAGIPGDTALEATSRIDTAMTESSPAVALIELGGNDFLRRRAPGAVKEDLREILHAVRRSGSIPVLISVPELSVFAAVTGRLSDSPIYGELADEENVLLIDNVFAEGVAEALRDAGLLAADAP